MADNDPGAGGDALDLNDPSVAEDVRSVNEGHPLDETVDELSRPFADGPAHLLLDVTEILAFYHACDTASPRVGYKMGAKVKSHGDVPGVDFTAVDCSGFFKEAIWRGTSPHIKTPSGSVRQHGWVKQQGFSKQTLEDGLQQDGAVRVAFLRPADSPQNIGHVALIHNGETIESHGGVGPNRRPWDMRHWQAKTTVYLLSPPAM